MQQNLFHRPPHGEQLHTATVVPSASAEISDCTLNGNKMWVFFTPNVPYNPAHLQEMKGTACEQDTNFVVCSNYWAKMHQFYHINQIPALEA